MTNTAPTPTRENARALFLRVYATQETIRLETERGNEIEIYSNGHHVGVNVWADYGFEVLFAEREVDHHKILNIIGKALRYG